MSECSSCLDMFSMTTRFLLEGESSSVHACKRLSDLGVLVHLGEYEPDFFAIALVWQTVWEDSSAIKMWTNVLPALAAAAVASSSCFDWMEEDLQKVLECKDDPESLDKVKSLSIRFLTLWFFSLPLGQLEHVVKLIVHSINSRRDIPMTLTEVLQLWSIFDELTKKGERDGICEPSTP